MVGGRGDVHIIRVYLPPTTNTLLSVAGHCLRSRQYVSVIVAG
jgi:xylulose-5-phosphate/fructose-6-phosphate phosphoketolase